MNYVKPLQGEIHLVNSYFVSMDPFILYSFLFSRGSNILLFGLPSGQFQALELELSRRREECIQLHTVLSDKTSGMKNIAQSSYGKDVDIMNEDGELVLAFEAQKKINR